MFVASNFDALLAACESVHPRKQTDKRSNTGVWPRLHGAFRGRPFTGCARAGRGPSTLARHVASGYSSAHFNIKNLRVLRRVAQVMSTLRQYYFVMSAFDGSTRPRWIIAA